MYSLKRLANLLLAVFLSALFVSGLPSDNSIKQGDLTVLVDFEKYQKLFGLSNQAEVCANSETEEYRKCGNKCVLGCRHSHSISGIKLPKSDCDETECVEGCFCKDGLIRYLNKCIPAKECPSRKNKAMDIMSDSNISNRTDFIPMQNQTKIQEQMKNQTVQTQIHVNNPKIFGFPFFNRGCQNPFGGCSVPVPVIHNYESVPKKENKHSEHSSHHHSSHHSSPNRSPVVVHIHSDGTVEGSSSASNNNDDNNNNNNSGGGGGGSGVWDGCGQNGCVDQQEWGEAGGDFPGFPTDFGSNGEFGNPGDFGNPAGFEGFPDFGDGIGGIRGSGISKGNGGIGAPYITHNSTTRTTTVNLGLYSVTYNPDGTRKLHVFGLGTYTFIADGTIISSHVGSKINLPFGLMNPSSGMTQSMPAKYDEVEDDERDASEEEYESEWQGNSKYQTPRPQTKPQRWPLKKPQYNDEEEYSEMEPVVHKKKPSKQNDGYTESHHMPYQIQQYQHFVNPNGRPYQMTAGAPVAPVQFVPFGFFNNPSSIDSSVVSKPSKKKTSENRPTSSKKPIKESIKTQTIYIPGPIPEYESNPKPQKKPSRKEKPSELGKLNTNLPEQPAYFSYMNPVSSQNYQNQPIYNTENGFAPQNNGQISPFIPFNNPFNSQNPSGIPAFPSFLPNQQSFGGSNDYPFQFEQSNGQINQFNPFNAQFNTQSSNKIPLQSNPTFNNGKVDNSFTYPFINRPFSGFTPQF